MWGVASVHDLFPFGDIDAEVVEAASRRFNGPPAESILAGIGLARAVVGLLDSLLDLLGRHGLSPARWRLLIALLFQSEGEGTTIGALAAHLGVKEPTVTATVDRLEREGLVRRMRDESDRRLVRVVATPEAAAAAARVIPAVSGSLERFVASMGGAEAVTGIGDRLAAATRSMLEEG